MSVELALVLKDPAGIVTRMQVGMTATGCPALKLSFQALEGLWIHIAEGHVVQVGWRSEVAAELHWEPSSIPLLTRRLPFVWHDGAEGRVIWLPEDDLDIRHEGTYARS